VHFDLNAVSTDFDWSKLHPRLRDDYLWASSKRQPAATRAIFLITPGRRGAPIKGSRLSGASPDAIELLVAAAKAKEGIVGSLVAWSSRHRSRWHTILVTGTTLERPRVGKVLSRNSSPAASFEGQGQKGQVFRLTNAGYQLADIINRRGAEGARRIRDLS
jgi:hypothetical protein